MKTNYIFLKIKNFDNPIITETSSYLDECFEDCPKNYYHKFKFECISDIKHKKITKTEIIKVTISGKNMDLYEIKKIESW